MIDPNLGKNNPKAIFNFEYPQDPTRDTGDSCEPWPLSADTVLCSGRPAGYERNVILLMNRSGQSSVLHSEPDMASAFQRYEDERRLEVLRLQSAARNSMEWFEEVERYLDLDPVQFNYSLLTRSQRISHENLRLRDPDWLGSAEKWFWDQAGSPRNDPRAPMFAATSKPETASRSPNGQY